MPENVFTPYPTFSTKEIVISKYVTVGWSFTPRWGDETRKGTFIRGATLDEANLGGFREDGVA